MKHIRGIRPSRVLGALILSSLTLASTIPAEAVRDDLTTSVQQAFLTRLTAEVRAKDVGSPLVETIRQADGWSFGSVTGQVPVGVHGAPPSALYLARPSGRHWQVEFDGSSGFQELAARAPLLSTEERGVLTPGRSASPTDGMSLPWRTGERWFFGGGPHGQNGQDRPFSSLDFNGGTGEVLAPADGVIYRSCARRGSALITLVHEGGIATSYYHMTNLTKVKNGTPVAAGDYLGRIGTAVPCGGYATGPHVHFSLRSGLDHLGVNGTSLGGWTFYEGSRAYDGRAERDGESVAPGEELTNFGP